MLAGTKVVPTGEIPSSAGLKTRLAMAVHFRPQKPIYAIDWHFFVLWAGNKYAIFRPVPIGYALFFQRKERTI